MNHFPATYVQMKQPLAPRVIVALTTLDGRLVRTTKYSAPRYVGDPINAVKLFSEKGADELVLLEIGKHPFDSGRKDAIRNIAAEAFMPISYGGGIRTIEHIRSVIRCGFEKVVLNSALHITPSLAKNAVDEFGSQAVMASMEVARSWLRGVHVRTNCGHKVACQKPLDWAKRCEEMGCGELMVTFIDKDGSMEGYDCDLISEISAAVSIPVIALGGAGTVEHLRAGLTAGATAVAAGSMFVFHGARRAVLINYRDLQRII
jgi:cyclase